MSETRWWKYVERLIGDDTAKDAARKAGFDGSAFTRWKNGANAGPEFVVKLARAYGVNVLDALVASGFITEDEADLHEVIPNVTELIRSVTDEQIAAEVLRRMRMSRDEKTPPHDGGTGSNRSTSADDAEAAARLVGATLAERRRIERSRERAQIEDRQRRSVEGE